MIFVYFVFFIIGTNQGETTVCSRKFTVAETHQKLPKKFKRRCRLWVTRKTPKTLLLVTCSLLWMNLRCIFKISLYENIYRTLKNYHVLKHKYILKYTIKDCNVLTQNYLTVCIYLQELNLSLFCIKLWLLYKMWLLQVYDYFLPDTVLTLTYVMVDISNINILFK